MTRHNKVPFTAPKKLVKLEPLAAPATPKNIEPPEIQNQPKTNLLKPLESSPEIQKEAPRTKQVIKIDIRKLVETIQPIMNDPDNPKTPLILDRTNRVHIFFEYSSDYSGIFIDAKRILLESFVFKRVSHSETMEMLRENLVNALKNGRTLVINMADSATDFKTKFTRSDCFPVSDLFAEGGRRLMREEYWSKVVRDSDKTQGIFCPRDGFGVIIVSYFGADSFEELLENSLPLEYLTPIEILPSTQSEGQYHP